MGTFAETEQEMFKRMRAQLVRFTPEAEIRLKAKLAFEINQLKREKNAIVLGHNYMESALYCSIPDFTGDSLSLCQRAAETDADVIVFCGVKFMAETAKILNPDKTVLLPSLKAGCSLAASITADDVRELKQRFPGVPVVTYVNSYADVKAETDVCCTSSNAAQVVKYLAADTIIFLPDEYLARNVANDLGWRVVFPDQVDAGDLAAGRLSNTLIGWHGRCEVHEMFTTEDVETVRKQFPRVAVLAHPECAPEVVAESDFAGSTSAMINYVKSTEAEEYLLLTECSMGDNIIAANPEKAILRLCSHRCPHMATITLEDTLAALQKNQFVIEVDDDTRGRALGSVQRMIEIT